MPTVVQTMTGPDNGAQVTQPGDVQYGPLLFATRTGAYFQSLEGWRDLPGAQVADSPRPQAHGAYAGSVLGDALTVAYTFMLDGTPDEREAAQLLIESTCAMDSTERMLCADIGSGPEFRMARVINRSITIDQLYPVNPLTVSLQFLCADPRRYGLEARNAAVDLPSSSGGLVYPLDYSAGLDYGTVNGGGGSALNDGTVPGPCIITFVGPLDTPILTSGAWVVGFDLTLAAGETLVVDTADGTALLNGNADRLYTLQPGSDPLERCMLPPGTTSFTLIGEGTGSATVTYRDTRM